MELDPDARRVLELTRDARAPSLDDKVRVEGKLSQVLQVAALSGAAGASAVTITKSASAALALKWVAVLGVPALVAAAAGTLHWRAPATPPSTPAPLSAPALPKVPAKAPANPQAEQPAVTEEHAGAAIAVEKAAVPAPRAREKSRPEKEVDTLNQELDLLHQAQAAWRKQNPGEALALLAQHRQKFPKSVLGPEREALRVLSLCAAGRTREAKDVARRAFGKAERSPVRASIEQSCIKD
jgi:hypothetical protein